MVASECELAHRIAIPLRMLFSDSIPSMHIKKLKRFDRVDIRKLALLVLYGRSLLERELKDE